MDVFLRALRAIPRHRLLLTLNSRPTERLLAGTLLGILAACGLGQHLAHWGSSGPTERGLAAALLIGLGCGYVLQRQASLRWPMWLMICAAASPILPWWLDQVAGWTGSVPPEIANSTMMFDLVNVAVALVSLGLPAACWSALICALCEESPASQDSVSPLQWAGFGCGLGVLLNALVLGPLCGAEITAILSAAAGLAISYRAANRHHIIDADDNPLIRPSATFSPEAGEKGPLLTRLLSLPALFAAGGAFSISGQLSQLLMTSSLYLQQSLWAVAVIGIAAGGVISRRLSHGQRVLWGLCAILVALSLNGWSFEIGVQFTLWSAAYLINATLHQLALIAVLVAAVLPISFGAGLLLDKPRAGMLTWGTFCFLCGNAVFRELSMTVSSHTLTVILLGGLTGLMLLALMIQRGISLVRWQAGLIATAVICGVLSPWIQPEIDPARPAKLLFSTQTFLAYRSGWKTGLLPYLDDSRLIAAKMGRHGPLTLWKSRGTDLLIREAGIPRCAMACRADVSPQAASEVLQTVLPLLVASESRNVLLLGSSGGVPLATFLSFPVEQVTCVEPDAERIALIRGPIAAEQGYDSFDDDRVAWDRRPVEWAAAMSDGGYDIIVSSPPLSSTSAALPQFTSEFYRNVSRKLSTHGLFCQRLEGIDYGPLPVQMVVKSLQSAFRDVVGVEIGVGEVLFLATNSDQGLVPKKLPERLETAHVRQVLARCGWDWSTLLTLPAWNHAALKEFAGEGPWQANSAANCGLAYAGPRDVLRWGPKLQEVQALLTKPRSDWPVAAVESYELEPAPPPSRRERYLDWVGDAGVSRDLLRRLSEVAAQAKIVHDNPDAFWLEYRKALRDELQQRPRTEIRQVAATAETERVLHPEDERRKAYFVSLGAAKNLEQKNLEAVYELRRFFEPYDPLMTLFARQEMAELLKYYGHPDPAQEAALRLHVIHFAPASDCSLRNVLAAADLILKCDDAVPDPQTRFDTLNGLLQTIRGRWDLRSAAQVKSLRLAIQDADRSLLTIDKAVQTMDGLIAAGQVESPGWPARKEVIEKLLVRPLRGYRADLLPVQQENKIKTDAVLLESKLNRKK